MTPREQQMERALREYIAVVDGGRQPDEPPQDFNDRGSHAYEQLRLALSTPREDPRLAGLRYVLDHFCKLPNHKRAAGFADWLDTEIARLSPPADQGETK